MLRRILFSLATASLVATSPALAAGDAGSSGKKHDCTCADHMARHDHKGPQEAGAAAQKKSGGEPQQSLPEADADWRSALNGSNGG